MVVKSEIRHIKSLQQKKYRTQLGLFVMEGKKGVMELLLAGFTPHKIYAEAGKVPAGLSLQTHEISRAEMARISSLKTPPGLLGVFPVPEVRKPDTSDWIVALDSVRDPGNLGTIIRLCDWFGIRHLVCSPDTADCFNPKVLQATMGSIARVNVVYEDLNGFLADKPEAVFGAFMDGDPPSGFEFPPSGILVLGNEAHGISEKVAAQVKSRIGIPQYGAPEAESLNVATAAAILLYEIRRPTQR